MQICFSLFSIFIIVLFLVIFSLQNINSQTLNQYEYQKNYSKYHIPSIKVGKDPTNIAVNEKTNLLFHN